MEYPSPSSRQQSLEPQTEQHPAAEQRPAENAAAATRAQLPRRRKVMLPICLFVITCLSTFWAGAAREYAPALLQGGAAMAEVVAFDWPAPLYNGLKYMAAVMGILLAHEMGHFLFTLRHRIPASFPLFIPFPISPFGTMGAVIAMQGSQADRRQLFDIGIAGPLAGLLVAVPVTCWGIQAAQPGANEFIYHHPLLVKMLIHALRPDLIDQSIRMNPMLMAGWVGLLVTGLNMLPMSQLDGGHITYALLRSKAHLLARAFLLVSVLFAIGVIVWTEQYTWVLMLLLISLIGVDHPKTANDDVPLGKPRIVLGYLSLLIPVLCFPPLGISAPPG